MGGRRLIVITLPGERRVGERRAARRSSGVVLLIK